MAQLTYGDVLTYLGLSNWQFIAITLVIICVWSFVSMLFKMGAVNKIKVTRKMLPSFKAIYISYEGSYNNIGTIYNQSVGDFEMVFKFSNNFAVYYGYHHNQQHSSKAIIGLAVNQMQQGKITLFLSKFPMYRTCNFSETECLAVKYPLLGSISSILVIGQVYPVLEQKLEELKIIRKHEQMVEIYHPNDSSPNMDIFVPLMNQEQFQIWYEPTNYSRVFDKKQQ